MSSSAADNTPFRDIAIWASGGNRTAADENLICVGSNGSYDLQGTLAAAYRIEEAHHRRSRISGERSTERQVENIRIAIARYEVFNLVAASGRCIMLHGGDVSQRIGSRLDDNHCEDLARHVADTYTKGDRTAEKFHVSIDKLVTSIIVAANQRIQDEDTVGSDDDVDIAGIASDSDSTFEEFMRDFGSKLWGVVHTEALISYALAFCGADRNSSVPKFMHRGKIVDGLMLSIVAAIEPKVRDAFIRNVKMRIRSTRLGEVIANRYAMEAVSISSYVNPAVAVAAFRNA